MEGGLDERTAADQEPLPGADSEEVDRESEDSFPASDPPSTQLGSV